MKIARACIALVSISLTLSGCLGAATRIEIDGDGSGSVEFSYRVSKLVAYIGSASSENRYLSIPLSRREVADLVADLDGIDLDSYSQTDDVEDLVFDVKLSFDTLGALETLFLSLDGPRLDFSVGEEGGTVLALSIYEGLADAPDEAVVEMIEAFFADYELVWTLRAPGKVLSASDGVIDGRTVEVRYETSKVLLSRAPVVWNVSW